MNEERKEEQKQFYNKWRSRPYTSQRERENSAPNIKYYSIVESRDKFIADWFIKNSDDKTVLDYCCGSGGESVKIAKLGASKVVGIDISDDSIKLARQMVEEVGLGERCNFSVMDAENTTFEDNTFDIIYCSGVLHHINLERGYAELSRVLKPSGRILCVEPLAYNPAIQWFRGRTPTIRTSWEIEHILQKRDIYLGGEFFHSLKILRFFYLLTIAAVPFRHMSIIFRPVRSILEIIDRVLLNIPLIQWYAWQVVFELSDPKKV